MRFWQLTKSVSIKTKIKKIKVILPTKKKKHLVEFSFADQQAKTLCRRPLEAIFGPDVYEEKEARFIHSYAKPLIQLK